MQLMMLSSVKMQFHLVLSLSLSHNTMDTHRAHLFQIIWIPENYKTSISKEWLKMMNKDIYGLALYVQLALQKQILMEPDSIWNGPTGCIDANALVSRQFPLLYGVLVVKKF